MITNLALFLAFAITITVAAILYAQHQKGWGWRATLNHFTSLDGGGILKGILMAVGALIVLGLLASAAYAEWRTFDHAVVYAGIDRTYKVSPQCVGKGFDDRSTSNLGIRQHMIGRDSVDLYLNYTHHSCAFNVDAKGYDGAGLAVQWVIR